MRMVGTKAMGIRTPIIREGDDLAAIVADSILEAGKIEGFSFDDRDVVGVTEAVVARAQGNYASTADIAEAVRGIFPSGNIGVVFPILSRNRFSVVLKGLAMGADQLTVLLSYPADEVGNELVTLDDVLSAGLDPRKDTLTASDFHKIFGAEVKHRFTGVDYVTYYESLGANIKVVLSSSPESILTYTDQVIAADIHSRHHTKTALMRRGATVVTLDEILTVPLNGSGFNAEYGLLGSNKAGEDRVKLFPRDCDAFVRDVQAKLYAATGKTIEVMVYGDGGFKDPVGGIWELADPVVSPGYTDGLKGTPNELKLKYLADTTFAHLDGAALRTAMVSAIASKTTSSLVGKMESEGTTPRQLTDLLGSLCDLTSGSGDKGTPVVYIKGYFDNYAS